MVWGVGVNAGVGSGEHTLAIHDVAGAVTVFEQPVIEKAEIAADVAMAGS